MTRNYIDVYAGARAYFGNSNRIEKIEHNYGDNYAMTEYPLDSSLFAKSLLNDQLGGCSQSFLASWLGNFYLSLKYDNCKIGALLLGLLNPVSVIVKQNGTSILFSDVKIDTTRLAETLDNRILLFFALPSRSRWNDCILESFGDGWVLEYITYFRDLEDSLPRQWRWDDIFEVYRRDIQLAKSKYPKFHELFWGKSILLWTESTGSSYLINQNDEIGRLDYPSWTIDSMGRGRFFWQHLQQSCNESDLSGYIQSAIELYAWERCNNRIENRELMWPFPKAQGRQNET
jgi:hypothetical protein